MTSIEEAMLDGDGNVRPFEDTFHSLIPSDPISNALATAETFDDFRQVRDMASAARAFAKARGLGIESENRAAEYVLRAERGMGQALERLAAEGRLANQGDWKNRRPGALTGEKNSTAANILTLAELGVPPPRATEWRALARLPEDEFESRFATVKATGARIAKVDFYRLVKGKTAKPEKPEAERDMHGEGYTAAFAAFDKAATGILATIGTLPDDELRALASHIKALVDAYNAERARR